MPPFVGSRHTFCLGARDDSGRLQLTEREPYRYQPHADNRVHVAAEGDTLFTLAGRYFAPLPRACGFWWVIADYQIDPVIDPTITLTPGRRIHIPSLRVLTDVILGEERRRDQG